MDVAIAEKLANKGELVISIDSCDEFISFMKQDCPTVDFVKLVEKNCYKVVNEVEIVLLNSLQSNVDEIEPIFCDVSKGKF